MASNNAENQAKRTNNNIRAPKVGHKKSRKGCQTCKARRVKCDEVYPKCGICQRLGLDCTYSYPEPPRARSKSTTTASSSNFQLSPGRASSRGSSTGIASSLADTEVPHLVHRPLPSDSNAAESRERRYMELRLLHHWMINVSRPFGLTAPPMWKELWHGEVPHVALENENALFAMLAMSATHLLGTYPNDETIAQARQNYWVWALREQRNAVSTIDDTTVDVTKTDAVAYAALLITMNALAMLQERSLEPYSPPMDWLEVGRGAFTVLPPYDKVSDGSGLKVLMDTTAPIWSANISLDFETQRDFGALLTSDCDPSETWDRETRESYESALSYICSFRRNLLMGQTADVSLRWICMFPFMVPRSFIDFIGEQRPRALVTLAYFFAVVSRTDALKYLGNTGELTTAHREIFAIRKALPHDWQTLMVWPLGEIGVG